ncbi:EamA family transporter [Levilactobacillus zymae]|uniref:EamA family transporter n=1 Tax=Levilactobacillus zymae TaxID=267363 RepID=UPI0028B90B07|nr:EamA family transporter [Levilactobacillus zymae]MDT6980243.1 EamA family transporter [Levilactobacillus zymae]
MYLGAVSTALAFLLWNLGLRLLHSRLSGLFFLWQPVVGALLGWWLLGEPLSLGFVIGFLLILASTWVASRFD